MIPVKEVSVASKPTKLQEGILSREIYYKSIKIDLGCKKHPQYEAKRAPKDCPYCQAIYEWKQGGVCGV
jgi:hypothetical protein